MGEFTSFALRSGFDTSWRRAETPAIIKKSFKNGEATEVTIVLFSMSPVAPAGACMCKLNLFAAVALTWLWEARSGSVSTCLWKKPTPLAFTEESAPPRVTVLGMKQLLVPWLFFSLSSAGSSGEASSCAPKSLLPGEEPRVCSCPWHGCLTAPLAALLHTAVSRGFGTKKKFTSD